MSPRAGVKYGHHGQHLPPEAVSLLKRAIMLKGREKVASDTGIDDRTLRRATDGYACSRDTYKRAVEYAARVLVELDWRAFPITGDAS
jgi:peptidoglycan/xylan/chitin deacetylase (PgdA/CDA1 family)